VSGSKAIDIIEALKSTILNGGFNVSKPLPSAAALMKKFGVARGKPPPDPLNRSSHKVIEINIPRRGIQCVDDSMHAKRVGHQKRCAFSRVVNVSQNDAPATFMPFSHLNRSRLKFNFFRWIAH